MCAIKGGKCVDTTMGMTPLEGLCMGTRSGDLDPAVHKHLNKTQGMSPDAVDTLLNKKSGLQGLCGDSDMRAIQVRRRLSPCTVHAAACTLSSSVQSEALNPNRPPSVLLARVSLRAERRRRALRCI